MAKTTLRGTLMPANLSGEDVIDVDIPGQIDIGDKDAEQSWNAWIDDLKSSENSGTIRAYKLSLSEDGNPSLGKGSKHALLGSWPHQMFDMDSMTEKLRSEFMNPGETAWFKITGTTQGKSGTIFSPIIKLIRSKQESGNGPESLTQIFKLMQDGNKQNAEMLREIIRPEVAAPVPVTTNFAQTAKEILAIVAPVMGPVLAALIARPAKPATDFGAMIEAMRSMKGFITGESEDGNNDSTTVAIIKSVAPVIPQLLAAIQAQRVPAQNAQIPRLAPPAPNPSIRQTEVFDSGGPAMVGQAPKLASQNIAGQQTPEIPQTFGMDKEMLDILKPQLEQLAEVAASGESAKSAAELIVQIITPMPQADRVLDALSNLIEDKARFQNLMILAPKIRAHAAWFEELRLALCELMLEPDEGDLTEGGK